MSEHGPSATRGYRIIAYLVLVVAAIIFLVPFYWLIRSSLLTQDRIFSLPPELIPHPAHWSNYADALHQTNLGRAFVNSVVIAVLHVSLSLFLCSLGGYAFAKLKAPGSGFLFSILLGTMLIPGAVTLIPVFIILARLHLVNTYWAMILPGAASVFGIFWMRQEISSNVHDDLLAAARIDGCSEFAIYWHVVVPVIRPAMGALAILTLISNWNNLQWAFVVLRTENMYTLPLTIYLLQGEISTPWGMLMASGVIATLPLVVAFLIFQRAFVSGITAGAVKG